VNWTGATSNQWTDPTNWSETPTDTIVHINHPANQPVVLSGTDTVVSLQLGEGAGGSLLILPGANLTTTGVSSRLGNGGTGLITQTGGNVVFGQHLSIADGGPGSGTYDLQGGTLSINGGYLTVGMRGPGFVNVSGTAAMTVNTSFNIGSSHVVPGGGNGLVTQTGGTVTANNGINLGSRSGTTGTYRLGGAGSILAINNASLRIGTGTIVSTDGGTGIFEQNGGTVNANAGIKLADLVSTSSAAYHLNAGTLNVTGNISDGPGSSVLNLNGGTLNLLSPAATVAVDTLCLGNASGTAGTFTLTSGKTLTATNLVVGNQGTGTFTHNGGTVNVTDIALASQTGATGNYRLNGGTFTVGGTITDGAGTSRLYLDGGVLALNGSSMTIDELYVGYQGGRTGSLTLSGPKTVTVTQLEVGENTGSSGSLQIGPEASLTVAGWSRIGNYGSAAIDQTGGQVKFNGGFALADGSGPGNYQLRGGTLVSNSLTIGMRGTGDLVVSDTGALETNLLYIGSRTSDNNGAVGTLTQTGGTVNAKGTGIILGHTAGGTGIYNLSGGELTATTIAQGSGAAVFDFTGGTLHANTINIPLTQDGGILAPGTSVGTTTINADYTLNAGSLQIELASPTTFDLLNVNGNVHLVGGRLELLLGYAPSLGDRFTILANDGTDAIDGFFSGLPEGGSVLASYGGVWYPFQITYRGGTGNDLALLSVPEPGTLSLCLLGLVGWLVRRRTPAQAAGLNGMTTSRGAVHSDRGAIGPRLL
jgi:hypothetical protein